MKDQAAKVCEHPLSLAEQAPVLNMQAPVKQMVPPKYSKLVKLLAEIIADNVITKAHEKRTSLSQV